MNGLIAINSNCPSNKYYATDKNSNGIYQLNSDWTINKSTNYLPNISLLFSSEWAVSNDAIYRIGDDNKIHQYKFLTMHDKVIELGTFQAYDLDIQHNNLIINDLDVSDTFIGKITFPE